MGRLESLTALGLGRGPYENDVVDSPGDEARPIGQQYNEHGHPWNPETKRREREHVRAANEVMQVTGVVEDSIAAKTKASEYLLDKHRDTITGLRLMEVGRAMLVGGVWGVLGLRRRILLYKPYAKVRLLDVLHHEREGYGALHVAGAGLPAVLAYHAIDWVEFLFETVVDASWDEENEDGPPLRPLTLTQRRLKYTLTTLLDIGFTYVNLHLRMFALLQQLALVRSSRLLPPRLYFIPFSILSPFQLPLSKPTSAVSWVLAVLRSTIPMATVLLHGKVKFLVSRYLYHHIYRLLPRPTGDSMFSGMSVSPPIAEYDTPDRNPDDRLTYRAEDEPTLRALEGLPAIERTEPYSRPIERDSDSSIAEDAEITQATLISFDVEATEAVDTPLGPLGTWSAELRSANEPKQSDEPRYRVTGLTMLPPILATEGLREIAAGILVLPIEALMARVIGRAYRASAGVDVEDIYPLTSSITGLGVKGVVNIASAFALQLGFTGIVWVGFTIGSQWWAARKHVNTKRNGAVEI